MIRVDWEALWDGSKACVKIGGKLSEYCDVKVGVRQGCVMSPWLFNVYMDGVIKEVKARIAGIGVKMSNNGDVWNTWTCLYADDTVLLAESERYLQKVVSEFENVCMRRKLKVNVGKSKVMIFEKREYEVIDFGTQYRIAKEERTGCKIKLGRENLEEVDSFKYLGAVLCKHGSMDGEVRERSIQGRRVIRKLVCFEKENSKSGSKEGT